MENEEFYETVITRLRDIHETNREQPLPLADNIYKDYLSDLFENEVECSACLSKLESANHIFILEIKAENRHHEVTDTQAYLVAELPLIKKLIKQLSEKLQSEYENETGNSKPGPELIKSLSRQSNLYNNTLIGELLFQIQKLEEREMVMSHNFENYTDERKNEMLHGIILSEHDAASSPEISDNSSVGYTGDDAMFTGGESVKPTPSRASDDDDEERDYQRAVETDEYLELQKMNLSGSWGKAVSRYGVQFLLRIHFRKYEFRTIKNLLINHQVAAHADLLFMKEVLAKMQSNTHNDVKLKDYLTEMEELRTLVLERLMEIDAAKERTSGYT